MMNYDITEARRKEYKRVSEESRKAKLKALSGNGPKPVQKINKPKLDPTSLMPKLPSNGLRALSLFSGGGGLDLGFDRAGFEHVASYEIIKIAADTLKANRPSWNVFGGEEGDVRKVDWKKYKNKVDIIHGGPPCQPFSIAGQRQGHLDERDMWPEFIRCVNEIKPIAFVAENVPGLISKKFESYVNEVIIKQLSDYQIHKFIANAHSFGVPQKRTRVIFVGFKKKDAFLAYKPPMPTHISPFEIKDSLFASDLPKCLGAREALGLEMKKFEDDLLPTIRSAFTGKRNTTSILNSKASEKVFEKMGLWPNGVQMDRETARLFVAKNNNFRLSVKDVGVLQGFPENWEFSGAVYQVLGQVGNSVPPPLAYNIAVSVAKALKKSSKI